MSTTSKLSFYPRIKKVVFLLSLIGGVGFTCHAMADEEVNKPAFFEQYDNSWIRATDSELAQLRGGFVLPSGMHIDFSLERNVSLNGVETLSSFFQLPENGILVQNESQNFASDLDNLTLNVVQNDLDNQLIKIDNQIDIELSNLQNIDFDSDGRVFDDLIAPNIHN